MVISDGFCRPGYPKHAYINVLIGTGAELSLNIFTGSTCSEDFDGCADNPCTMKTNCSDLTPAEHVAQNKAFTCSECPAGYALDADICVGR